MKVVKKNNNTGLGYRLGSRIFIGLFIVFIIVCIIIVCIYYGTFKEFFENLGLTNSKKIFKAPMSMTKIYHAGSESGLESTLQPLQPISSSGTDNLSTKDLKILLSKIEKSRKELYGNILDFPSFFHSADKWPGCLPRPLYQGSCGSCWGFASVTALSSRFYIESCGLSGCKNYPQINFGSINNVNFNINEIYKFKKLYLTDAFEQIDVNNDGTLSKKEWIDVITDYQKTFSSQTSPYIDRYYISQLLVYMLNFQSLGSIDLTNKSIVLERASEAFDIWISLLGKNNKEPQETQSPKDPKTQDSKVLVIEDLKNFWLFEPVTLSAEKIISCCNTCMKLDYIPGSKESNPVCLGSTLDEAWSMLRESGTTTVDCIGYNLDAWTEGSYSPSCKEVQGPTYSFCSGYVIDKSNFQIGDRSGTKSSEWKSDIDTLLSNYENSTLQPIAIPGTEKNIPWIDPQLFRFRAKNVYKVNPNVKSIQREILERGPVTTGFDMYDDFQYSFGLTGGQKYKDITKNPLGSSKDSLIYMWNGTGKPIGGHAIVIVGWGTYEYIEPTTEENLEIPYWICLNSWGYLWGTSGISNYENRKGLPNDMTCGGYFWMLRGLNICGIEENVIVGQPDIYNISYPNVPTRYGWGLPNPSTEDVTFIKQKTDIIDLGADNFLLYNKPIDGGGSYTDRIRKDNTTTWVIESMKAPSPYVLFWNSSRPIYCIGKVTSKISEMVTDTSISVDQESIDALKKISIIQKNPLLVIDDEQLQFIDFVEPVNSLRIRVVRGVNNSALTKHLEGASIKVVPYKNLSTENLDAVSKKCIIEKIDIE